MLTKLLCMTFLTAIILPTNMLASSKLSFSEFGLDDGKPCKLPLQNEKLVIIYDNGKVEYSKTKKVMVFLHGYQHHHQG